MKINKVEQLGFKPVNLMLTFETAEELEMFKTIFWYTETIPEVITSQMDDQVKLTQFMDDVNNQINKLKL